MSKPGSTDTADASYRASASQPIRVVVAGPTGRMGQVMMAGLPTQRGIDVIGGISRTDDTASVAKLFSRADVLVEFTHVDSSPELFERAIAAGVRPVSGTSGLSDQVLTDLDAAAKKKGIAAVWASPFKPGGALMMHLARIAARYLDSVEIVEIHHPLKADAPSGAALELVHLMRTAHGADLSDPPVQHESLTGTRGGVHGGIRVHSLRLPGILSRHEIIFGGEQELLTIGYHETGREGSVPAVARAVHKVMQPGVAGLIRGYDAVMGLSAP
jgi:4-hydroxy-tetrahydrodipicolinate reductase